MISSEYNHFASFPGTFTFFLGLLDIILALFVLVLSTTITLCKRKIIGVLGITLYVLQTIFLPLAILLVGFILLFQGWRIDPILILAVVLLHLSIIYLIIKDIVIFNIISQNN